MSLETPQKNTDSPEQPRTPPEMNESPEKEARANENPQEKNKNKNEEKADNIEEKTPEEALEYYIKTKNEALAILNFEIANLCQVKIDQYSAIIIEENVRDFCDDFESSCDDIFEIFRRKLKKTIKRCHLQEIDIRTDISKRFQNTEVIHLARISQHDDEFFSRYLKSLISQEDTKYNKAIAKAKKLALMGSYQEAEEIRLDAQKEHANIISLREQEITKQYKVKAKQIMDSQKQDFAILSRQLANSLNELRKVKSNLIDLLYKGVKADLDRLYAKYAEKINKQFATFSNPNMKKTPKQMFEEFYADYLMRKNLIPPKVEKIYTERMRKEKAKEDRKKRIQEEKERKKMETPKHVSFSFPPGTDLRPKELKLLNEQKNAV